MKKPGGDITDQAREQIVSAKTSSSIGSSEKSASRGRRRNDNISPGDCESELARLTRQLSEETEARKRAEEKADTTLKLLSSVLNTLDSTIWVIDSETRSPLLATALQGHAGRFSEEQALMLLNKFSVCVPGTDQVADQAEERLKGEFHDIDSGQRFDVSAVEVDWTDGRKAQLTIASDVTAIRHTEEALREIEARFRATLDNAAQAITLTDDKGRFTQVNPAWEKMFGYTAEEAARLTHVDVTHPDFLEISKEKLSALTRGELDLYRMEKQYIRKDGTAFWADLSVTPVQTLDRQVGAAVGVIVDITETKKAQEALQERDALISALYNKVAQAIASTDHKGKFIEVNPAFERMFGYTRSEALELTHLDITVPEFIVLSEEKADALFKRELDSYRMEKRYFRKDGSTFWADVSISAIHQPDNRVQSVGIIVDISDRKKAEEALQKAHDELEQRVLERTAELAETNEKLEREIGERARTQEALKESEERFRAIFETAKDCVFIKDRDLRYTLINPSMESLLELPAAVIMKSTDEDLFGPESADHLHQLDLRVLTGEIIEAEHTRPVRGIPMTFLDIRAPMRNERGVIAGICGISRNITERTKTGPAKVVTVEEGPSATMRSTLAEARMAAKTDIIILLTGESGAGKDHLARFIHDNSRRASGPFYAINCAAIPPELAESELFGHEAGAFTGAKRRKRGLLELAEGGTLLLNEIGELPLHLQAKLLTFLDTRSFTRVGGEKSVTVSARLIAATNRHLDEEVAKGRFRHDLYYRLNVLSIRVPPLKERIEDIPTLVRQINSHLAQELQLPGTPSISGDDMAKLCAYKWPGNVRELRNVLERSVIVSDGQELKFDFLECEAAATSLGSWTIHFPPVPSFVHVVTEIRRNLILEALARSGGNKQEASRLLGVSRYTLRRQLKTLKL
ncbi:MAG: PAS domain S-box protein [Desulfomonile tiedjei]|uniref:PAS domain S-box protein n=1 Tax=Desulfomonile tiedjei TaxID=2358 RepID=A0A9D6Z2H5_9BACT|nr:PAS domain S-box protein [Desulfomonile tiedjei]